MAEFVVGDAGVPEGYIGLVSALLQGDGYDRLGALGAFGHPGEFDQARALHLGEAAIVRPDAAFVLDREVVQTIDHWIEDDALGAVPRSAGAFGVDPDVVDFVGGCGNVRLTVISVKFIFISPFDFVAPFDFVGQKIVGGDRGGNSRTARI